MPDMTNDDRADLARTACEDFSESTGQSMEDELGNIITDLMADLLHLANREGLCADSLVRRATMHYEAEITEEEECDAID